MTDEEFQTAFETLTLPPARFDHASHVRLAWLYLKDQPLPEAMQRYRDGLKAFAAHIGQPAKYHETITFAFLSMIRERMAKSSETEDWETFRAGNTDLFGSVPKLMGVWYSDDRLNDADARSGFVMPDRYAI